MLDHDAALELYMRGKGLLEQGAPDQAARTLIDSWNSAPHFKTAELLGDTYRELGRPKDALLYYAAAIGLGSKQSKAMYSLALCLEELGELFSAFRKVDESLSVNPKLRRAVEMRERLLATYEVLRKREELESTAE